MKKGEYLHKVLEDYEEMSCFFQMAIDPEGESC